MALWLRQSKYDKKRANRPRVDFARVFSKERFFLEIQQHGIPEEAIVPPRGCSNSAAILASASWQPMTRITSIARTPEAHDVLLAIGTGRRSRRPQAVFEFTGSESYVKSESEMRRLFPDHGDTIELTQTIANRCEFDFEKQYFLPAFPAPPNTRAT